MADDGAGGGLVGGAVASALIAGGIKLIDLWKAKKEREAENSVVRQREVRSELERVEKRNDELQAALDKLRDEFWQQREGTVKLQHAHQECLQREASLKRQVDEIQANNRFLRDDLDALREQVNELRRRGT